jgi:hypothetical protein
LLFGPKPQIFDFPSPASGSTCADAAEHLRRQVSGGIKQVGNIYFHSTPPEGFSPRFPYDFAVFIERSGNRDTFLGLKQDVVGELDDWLEPAGLKADDYRIAWVPYPIQFEERQRDPVSGRLVTASLTSEDQVSGSLCVDS